MTTRNYIPNANQEGNIGLLTRQWLKGWFKDLYVSGNFTDGTLNKTLAQLANGGRFSTGDKHIITFTMPVVDADGQTTSTSNTPAQRTGLPLDLNHARWTLSGFSGPVITFTIVGRSVNGVNTATYDIYNLTDSAVITDSEQTTTSNVTHQILERVIARANFPATKKFLGIRTSTPSAGTVELEYAGIELEYTAL